MEASNDLHPYLGADHSSRSDHWPRDNLVSADKHLQSDKSPHGASSYGWMNVAFYFNTKCNTQYCTDSAIYPSKNGLDLVLQHDFCYWATTEF